MRIAMLTNNYKPFVGGVPISIERLSDGLRSRGHTVTIFAPRYENQVEEAGVVRYRSRKYKLAGGIVIPDALDRVVEKNFKNGDFDLIHVHHPMLIGYTSLYLAKKYNVPVAFTYHTRYEQYLHYICPIFGGDGAMNRMGARIVTAHNRAFTNRCDLTFAPTPMMRDHLVENGTLCPVHVLPTGLAESDFACDEKKAADIRRRYAPDGRRLLCTVSRLEKEKNLPFLLRALARYKREGGEPFRLLMIGAGTQRGELEALAASLGVGDCVSFLGSVEHGELASHYGACDLFVFTSHSETQGIVLLEGMAGRLPVVAVSASGVCDVVQYGLNGFCTQEDEGEFAAAIGKVFSSPAFHLRMSRFALSTARRYTAARVAADAERHYEAMLEERRSMMYGYSLGN